MQSPRIGKMVKIHLCELMLVRESGISDLILLHADY